METLGSLTTPDGHELVLYRRGGVFEIRFDGLELMSSRAHGSEEALARLAFRSLGSRPRAAPRVLVGGLGLGYTLRAALELLPARAEVVVVEVFQEVVDWNRGLLAPLAGRPLDDPRVRLETCDVFDFLEGSQLFDAVVLDVDNGPGALSLPSNGRLYSRTGLERLYRTLTPNGVLAVWSPSPDEGFAARLRESGFRVRLETVPVRESRDHSVRHTIFLADRRAPSAHVLPPAPGRPDGAAVDPSPRSDRGSGGGDLTGRRGLTGRWDGGARTRRRGRGTRRRGSV